MRRFSNGYLQEKDKASILKAPGSEMIVVQQVISRRSSSGVTTEGLNEK